MLLCLPLAFAPALVFGYSCLSLLFLLFLLLLPLLLLVVVLLLLVFHNDGAFRSEAWR